VDEAALEIVGALASTNDLNDARTRRTYLKTVQIKADCYQPLGMRHRAQSR
jgi:hypothetical protein